MRRNRQGRGIGRPRGRGAMAMMEHQQRMGAQQQQQQQQPTAVGVQPAGGAGRGTGAGGQPWVGPQGRLRGRGQGGRYQRVTPQQYQAMQREKERREAMNRAKRTPHFLEYLNNYNAMQLMTYLTLEDREKLGIAYPRFKSQQPKQFQPPPSYNQEQPTGAAAPADEPCKNEAAEKKDDSAANTAEAEKAVSELEINDKAPDPEAATAEGEKHEAGENAAASEEKNESENAEACLKEGKKGKEEKHTSIAEPNPSISDPHTLLARLNSKRLYRRMRFLQKQGQPTSKAYPLNMTTEQIANQEWANLLQEFKETQLRKLRLAEKKEELQEAKEEENKETKEDDQEHIKGYEIPSSTELLLFSPCPRAVAVLASYPRSGNSLLRTLYERTTLRVTGSDMRGGLTKHDLVGEMAVQTNCVQFVKTHFPERKGYPPFGVNRAVLLVRNPYDAMESYFNLMTTNTHTASLSDEERAKYAKVFSEMAQKEILVWRDFHEYWLQQNIPLLVIRYEDLIRYTDKVISKVIRFVLEINDMTFFEKRIDRCIREEQIERLGSYKPRSGGIGKSLSKYSPELLQKVNMSGILSTMRKFGYDEMMVPRPDEWRLDPIDQYGVEIVPPDIPMTNANGNPNETKPLVINGQNLVRGPKRHTDWRQVKQLMSRDGEQPKCTCAKCRSRR